MSNKTTFILAGGFLGAGKTTLLYETTKYLMRQGKKVGLITNDQASELVDTAFLLQTQAEVAEVSGSCFCCNFDGFIDAVQQMDERSEADYIIAEPVGSCTDLSATIMQPLKDFFKEKLSISPLSVLADPKRLHKILEGDKDGLHPSAVYIFKKQLEESDFIIITKTDLLEPDELEFLKEKTKAHFPQSTIMAISAVEKTGIKEWLKKISESSETGNRILDINYDIYAEGEAVLGWLNASIRLKGKEINWDKLSSDLLKIFITKINARKAGIGHIKMVLEAGTKYIKGNITGTPDTLTLLGSAGTSNESQMIINARVEMSPEDLGNLLKETLDEITKYNISFHIHAWNCLSPGYPKPTYRYKKIV